MTVLFAQTLYDVKTNFSSSPVDSETSYQVILFFLNMDKCIYAPVTQLNRAYVAIKLLRLFLATT